MQKKSFFKFCKFSVHAITALITALIFSACDSNQIAGCRTDVIAVNFPIWPPDDTQGYPELQNWKITVLNRFGSKTYYRSPDEKFISLEISKDKLSAIQVFPVTQEEFFYPAGCVYPVDFLESSKADALWKNGALAKIVAEALLNENFKTKENLLYYFNWNKLKTALNKNEEEAFEKFDIKNPKKNKISFYADISATVQKIYDSPSRFTVEYFESKALDIKKNDDLKIYEGSNILLPYIPLNDFCKEKGCITVLNESQNHITAIFINGKTVYLKNSSA